MLDYLLKDIIDFPVRGYILNYGIYYPLIITGIFIGLHGTYKRLLQIGYDAKKVRRFVIILIFIGFPLAIISAQSANMFYYSPKIWSLRFFLEQLWDGNYITFHAGIVLPFIAITALIVIFKFKFLEVYDAMLLYLPLGHAAGRLGCFLVGCCWGNRLSFHFLDTFYQFANPVPFYEGNINIIIFLVLKNVYGRVYAAEKGEDYRGLVAALYFILYGIARFMLEFFRVELKVAGLLTQAQIAALCMILIGSGLIMRIIINSIRKKIY